MNRALRLSLWVIQPVLLKSWAADLVSAIPRIFCGYVLAADFGASKFGMPWSPPENNLGLFEVAYWFPGDVAEYGGLFALFPAFFAWMGAFSEAVGGIMLALGFKTRVAAFLIICTMLVAIFFQKWGYLWSVLPALSFLWVSLYQLLLGSGRFGLDYLMAKALQNRLNTSR